MQQVAIDFGGRESQICVRDASERILEEKRYPTKKLGEYLAKQPPSRVILETSAEAFAVADLALLAGHEVRVVPSMLAPSLGIGARGIKTDRRDAQVLSEVSCRVDLRSVHIPSPRARLWRALCNSRDSLVSSRTKLTNTVKCQLRGRLISMQRRISGITTARVRDIWVELEGAVPEHIERLPVMVEALTVQIREAKRTGSRQRERGQTPLKRTERERGQIPLAQLAEPAFALLENERERGQIPLAQLAEPAFALLAICIRRERGLENGVTQRTGSENGVRPHLLNLRSRPLRSWPTASAADRGLSPHVRRVMPIAGVSERRRQRPDRWSASVIGAGCDVGEATYV